jgi:SAM-dependent methyltransferase
MILDVGCGGTLGYTKLDNRRRFNADVGIDILKCKGVDVQATIYNLPFGAVFDKVYLSEVLEHLECPAHALRSIRTVMKHGACLVVAVPNRYHWTAIIRWILKGTLNSFPEHIGCWHVDELEHLLNLTGFKVEKFTFAERKHKRWSGFTWLFPRITMHSLVAIAVLQ